MLKTSRTNDSIHINPLPVAHSTRQYISLFEIGRPEYISLSRYAYMYYFQSSLDTVEPLINARTKAPRQRWYNVLSANGVINETSIRISPPVHRWMIFETIRGVSRHEKHIGKFFSDDAEKVEENFVRFLCI